MKKFLLIIIVWVSAISCEEPFDLDVEDSPTKLVIEGLVTNQSKHHFVKLSESVPFYQDGKTPRVENAIVSVQDNEGNLFNYEHNPNSHPDSSGYYLSTEAFTGKAGNTYKLTVTVGDESYTAEDELFPVTTIDSLTIELDEEEFRNPENDGEFYEILFYAKEPQERKDYYLFKFYKNGEIYLDFDTDIYFADDEAVGESIEGLPTAGYYALNDVARVEMYSLSRDGFIYYTDLFNVLNNDGGMFSQPPVNPRTNLTNGALGFFQASAIDAEEIVVVP